MCRILSISVIVFLTLIVKIQCGRSSSGHSSSHSSSHSSGHSYSHPSYSSHPSPSYSHPSPSYSHPSPSYSPSYSHPSPSYSPSYSHPSPSYSPSSSHPSPSYSNPSYNSHPSSSISRPSATHPSPASLSYPEYRPLPVAPVYRPSGTNTRPIGFQPDSHPSSGPIGPPKQVSNVGNAPTHTGSDSSITRPIGFVPPGSPGHSSSGTSSNSGPLGPPKTIAGVGNAAGANYGGKQPAFNPNYNTAGTGHPVAGAPPAYNPAGYGAPPAYSPAGHGSPGGFNFPPPAYSPAGHPGYSTGGYHAPPAYSPHPGGSSVTVINNNNYHYGSSYPAYVPTYHYSTVDTGSSHLGFFLGYSLGRLTSPSYHYHSSVYTDTSPRYDHYEVHHYYHNSNSVPKEATIQPNAVVTCVGDTGSFCTANTTPLCTNNGAVMCVASATSTVPCLNEKQVNCVKSSIPCLNSTAPECVGLSAKESATVSLPCISTAKILANVTFVNNTLIIANTTIQNSTDSNSNSTTTPSPITTTVTPQTPQNFCVTILALPAERKLTENEKLAKSIDSIFGKFAVKALGVA